MRKKKNVTCNSYIKEAPLKWDKTRRDIEPTRRQQKEHLKIRNLKLILTILKKTEPLMKN